MTPSLPSHDRLGARQARGGTRTVSLRTRLTLLLAVATLIALGIAARVVDVRADAEMQQRFDASLLARAQAFAALVSAGGDGMAVDDLADRTARFPGGDRNDWYVVTCGGRLVAHSDPPLPHVAAGDSAGFANGRLANGLELRVVTLAFSLEASRATDTNRGLTRCVLRYALDRGPLDDILRTLDWILLGSIFGACALVLLVTPWLVGRGLRPVTVLGQSMTGIGPDAPGRRLPTNRTAELVPLVARFNEVLARMDFGLAHERQFAAGLAHEFRTRLAELRTLVEVESRYPSGRDTRAILAEVGSIGTQLEATVTALLQLTRIQSGLEQMRPETVPLASLLARLGTRHRDAAQARGVVIDTEVPMDPDLAVDADRALLDIVLENLVGNAVAYAPEASTITLRATRDGIDVRNAAPQLHPDDLANFGQRFWRKDAQGAEHAGLGLALSFAAARAMGMVLTFELTDDVLDARLGFAH